MRTIVALLATLPFAALAGGYNDEPEIYGEQEQAQGQAQRQHADANSKQGQSMTDASEYLAISLPGHSSAAPVANCHESNGSRGALGIGSGGKTRINAECQAEFEADRTDRREFEQCMAIATAFAAFGHNDAALAQAARCGGVDVPPTDDNRERVRRAFEAAQSK